MRRTKTLELTPREAKMLAQAASNFETDWLRDEGQSWRAFEDETGLTKADHDAFHDALAKLWKVVRGR